MPDEHDYDNMSDEELRATDIVPEDEGDIGNDMTEPRPCCFYRYLNRDRSRPHRRNNR